MSDTRLIVLSGPTASGKTAAAVFLARLFPLEIINADSMQVYRGMDIGTAKPTAAEREQVPHHLVDVADPDEIYSAGRFVAEAEEAIRAIRERGRWPLVSGGTGMYLRALLRGLDALPSDARVRERLARRWEKEGGEVLHAELERIDPVSAARIHPSDRLRVVRALEVAEMTGEPASGRKTSWAGGRSRYRYLFLVLDVDRAERARRIDLRVDAMIHAGLVEEVRGLLERGYGRDLPSMGALGYRHVLSHLLDGVPLEEAIARMKRDTRRYAKRQVTWLSGEPGVVRLGGKDPLGAAAEEVRKFL
ncbi:MAG TPA: tRNA (adenosine(37)-N6)-dimethylallyltransferase MiaA [Candidatus Deferrimicrobiaceae bacterium]|nr:tRNA (adenosine(37)-N6)-dimethylallyltransferase MiaA [Candidatus Deferrimicrobiaceae bacterium]